MSNKLNLDFDAALIEKVAADFDLRAPNREALRKLVFDLNGDYDPEVMQVMNLATGVGKTYLMASFIEYLRLQGIGNVMIVTPGKIIQDKTIQNFTVGSSRYIAGSELPPDIVTPQDYSAWRNRLNGLVAGGGNQNTPTLAFIFNIQQLIAPRSNDGDTHGSTEQASRRKPRKFDESSGVLFDYLKDLDDLVVIADESHLYSETAVAFNAALKELDPAAIVGLTASPSIDDFVVWKYPLYQAIQDKYVKAPVLAFRKEGYGDESEEQQLSDAVQLRAIKQRYYDAYCDSKGLPHLNAVLFVVCSDVNHATDITELLRTPRYFGEQLAVLQVDNAHDDAPTQTLLERLDEPDSPVLAVVSVNKLKEGWDVKNIAVVVTLRAMASEVLTQQTMGRGLRLPFGKYTNVLQIDQLDIIAHQSFEELLVAENILVQFGLEEAVSDGGQAAADEAIKAALEKLEQQQSTEKKPEPQPVVQHKFHLVNTINGPRFELDDGELLGNTVEQPELFSVDDESGIGIASLGDAFFGAENGQGVLGTNAIKRNPGLEEVTYTFPCTQIKPQQIEINLSEIDENEIRYAADRITSSGDVLLRKEIVAKLGNKITAKDTESAEVESILVEEEEARTVLTGLVIDDGLVPVTQENIRLAKDYLVKKFMQFANVDHWTIKSLDSATSELRDLVCKFVNKKITNRGVVTTIYPNELPPFKNLKLNLGEKVYEQIDKPAEFKRARFYDGWSKSIFEAESFDSYTGEYCLAKLLDTSPHVVWWHRLHIEYGACIFYTPANKYNPDFVVFDDEGCYWIVEAKAQHGKTDQIVQEKRKAAEKVVHRLVGEEQFAGQKWGYLIGYEDDIQSSDSWNDLKAKSHPVSNA